MKQIRERATMPGKFGKRSLNPIPTSGETLSDGSVLALIRDSKTGRDRILHWREGRFTISAQGEFAGCSYVPVATAAALRHLPLAGSRIEVDLTITDEYGEKHSSEIEVGLDPTEVIRSLNFRSHPVRGSFDKYKSEGLVHDSSQNGHSPSDHKQS